MNGVRSELCRTVAFSAFSKQNTNLPKKKEQRKTTTQMKKQRAKKQQGTSPIILFLLVLNVVGIATVASAKALPVQWLSGFKSFAAGGVGGVMSVLVGHPFDLVKVRMQTSIETTSVQTSEGGTKRHKPRTTSTFGAFQRIVKAEGVRGLYRGVSAPILAVAPIFATSFWGFDMGDRFVRMVCHTPPGSPLSLMQLCVAGGISALPTALVMVPSERIKCIMQIQASDDGPSHPPSSPRRGGSTSVAAAEGTRRYTSFMDCATDLYRQGGIRALYKGTKLTLMRDIPGNMVYFGVYEVAKRQLTSGGGGANPLAPMVAGALAGILFWPVVLPTDTLKSRYQTAPEGTYKGIGQVYRDLVRREGLGGLFRGIRPAMMRSAPANAVSFMGAELTKNALTFIP